MSTPQTEPATVWCDLCEKAVVLGECPPCDQWEREHYGNSILDEPDPLGPE